MEFPERLKELRLEAKLTQVEVSKYLNIRQSAYVNYEKGANMPLAANLKKLAKLFNVSISYLLGETNIRSSYEIVDLMEKLSEPRQKETINFAKNKLVEQQKENKIIAFNQSLYGYEVYNDQELSAGKGGLISDDVATSTVYWTKKVICDYGIPIKGDSMEPDYHDKEIALIQEQPYPDMDGDVCAVYDFNKEASYIKCVHVEDEFLRLESLNRSVDDEGNLIYGDIFLPRDESVKILGKVVDSFTPVEKKEI